MLREAGFHRAAIHEKTGYATSKYTQAHGIVARKPLA